MGGIGENNGNVMYPKKTRPAKAVIGRNPKPSRKPEDLAMLTIRQKAEMHKRIKEQRERRFPKIKN